MKKQLLQILNRNGLVFTCSVAVAAFIAGCGKTDAPTQVASTPPKQIAPPIKQPEKPVQTVMSAAKKLSIPPAPVGNQFDFSNKKDPFKPDIAVKTVSASQSADMRKAALPMLPIHSFDVSQFRLIGIITGSKENQAMVVDPGGKGYVLKQGMTIGKNEGRIVSISSGGVDVVEQFKDDNGRIRKENIRLTLPRKQ